MRFGGKVLGMAEQPPDSESSSESSGILGKVLNRASAIGIFLTFTATIVNVLLTSHNASILDRTQHAEKFAAAFANNAPAITGFMRSNQRVDEQVADMSLSALYDSAESTDDRIAMLTIAARMLNATDCASSGEATARFLSVIVTQIKENRYPERDVLLRFVRSRAFLGLASTDITTVYDNDDGNDPLRCGSTTTIEQRTTPQGSPSPSTTQAPMFTPSSGGPRNHATIWGEQASWNDAKNELFALLRPDDYDGWIHIATWEEADDCVDEKGLRRTTYDPVKKQSVSVACTPVRVHYTSTPFVFARDVPSNAQGPFWLGRARFLRDAAPVYYRHADDSDMRDRGVLGRLIGVAEAGECVQPRGKPRYVEVFTKDDRRRFVHVWLEVGPAGAGACSSGL